MTIFENIKKMTIDEFAEWIDSLEIVDSTPWINWFDKNYCSKCESESVCVKDYYKQEMKFAWCELYDKCKFFPDMNETPDSKQMIKMWLESECEYGKTDKKTE